MLLLKWIRYLTKNAAQLKKYLPVEIKMKMLSTNYAEILLFCLLKDFFYGIFMHHEIHHF